MSTQRNEQDYMKLNLQHEMTLEELNEIVTHIKYIPEPPLLDGFAEEAMNRWRSSKRALPGQESPVPLSARQQIKILFHKDGGESLYLA